MDPLRIGSILEETLAEGPGSRFALWVQGCSLRCPGCCNPHLFESNAGEAHSLESLLARLESAMARASDSAAPIEGITLLGGEPFEQAAPLAAFARGARALGLSTMAFSGYTLEELRGPAAPPASGDLLAALDLLVDGRYVASLPEQSRRWAGSTNQRFHYLTDRYPLDMEHIDPGEISRTVELRISPNGEALLSGWPEHLQLGRRLRAKPT